MCRKIMVDKSVCYHSNCHILGIYVENKVSLDFSWQFNSCSLSITLLSSLHVLLLRNNIVCNRILVVTVGLHVVVRVGAELQDKYLMEGIVSFKT
jgi:hypothetical protein